MRPERHHGTPAGLLLLADSRLPAGGHAHSGGLEPAAAAGAVTGPADLADFLRGRLATTGLVTAALAAAACAHADPHRDHANMRGASAGVQGVERQDHRHAAGREDGWSRLDAEVDARTPSPAQRKASRAQGRALLRAARTAWPHPALDSLATAHRSQPISARSHSMDRADVARRDHQGEARAPHHAVALGVAAAAAGGTPEQAAAIAAYGSVTGPASAAVRLLGLDPLAVHRVLADLAPQVDAVAGDAAAAAAGTGGDWAMLPAPSAPTLDLFAELHAGADRRLFES